MLLPLSNKLAYVRIPTPSIAELLLKLRTIVFLSLLWYTVYTIRWANRRFSWKFLFSFSAFRVVGGKEKSNHADRPRAEELYVYTVQNDLLWKVDIIISTWLVLVQVQTKNLLND